MAAKRVGTAVPVVNPVHLAFSAESGDELPHVGPAGAYLLGTNRAAALEFFS
jgi:hypothetical protein